MKKEAYELLKEYNRQYKKPKEEDWDKLMQEAYEKNSFEAFYVDQTPKYSLR